MFSRVRSLVIAVGLALCALPAHAHPHVFVTVKTTAVFAGGVLNAVRHSWRFDDMFSAFAAQGLDTDADGKLSRSELQALAEVNVTSLKEFDFFTFGKAGNADITFQEPVDYWLDHDGSALTLNFTLPASAAAAAETVRLEIYDPSYFVSFSLADEQPAVLEGAPGDCRIDTEGAQATGSEKLTEDFFSNLDPEEGWGKQFANVMTVRCGAAALAYAESIAPKPVAPEPEPAAAPPVNDEAALLRVEQAISIAEAKPLAPAPSLDRDSGNPALAFGIVRPDSVAAQTTAGPFGWIMAQQSHFYRQMSDALTAAKADGSAFLLLIGLSFAYGVFHAAGPGHGKAVISSYLLATGETLRRGIAISFAAAMAQAVMAVAIVGIMAVMLGATSQAMGIASWWLEAASYVLIAALGIGLLFRRSLIPVRGHVHDGNCDHRHGPSLEDLDGPFGWRRAAAAILAIGLRPCTGALLILVFAIAQGLVWAGVAATFAMAVGTAITVAVIAALAVFAKNVAVRLAAGTSRPRTRQALRLIEITAGFAVLAFGLMLLGGLITGGAPVAG